MTNPLAITAARAAKVFEWMCGTTPILIVYTDEKKYRHAVGFTTKPNEMLQQKLVIRWNASTAIYFNYPYAHTEVKVYLKDERVIVDVQGPDSNTTAYTQLFQTLWGYTLR